MRVLVADGDKVARRAIVDSLAQLEGATIVGAVPDLEGAIRAIAEAEPDIVVTGVALTDGNARELVEAVRHDAAGPRIVVLGVASGREVWSPYLDVGAIQFVECDRGLDELTEVVGALGRTPHESLTQLVEGAAHDLALYLEATRATLALASRQPADDQLKRDAGRAVEQARRLAGTLARYVRAEPMERCVVDLAAIVRATVLLARRAVLSPVGIAIEVVGDPPLVHGVPSELEQMVLNLVLTVRGWLPDHGDLVIRVERQANAAMIELTSSGGDRRTTTNACGSTRTGSLGIVRRVLQRHRAAMVIVPRVPAGTTIRVLLPLA